MKYIHTNLTVENLEMMSNFYQRVFDCIPVRDSDDLDGQWVEEITNVKEAAIRYVHLTLPGFGENGPELELIQYQNEISQPQKISNCSGYGHLAFSVANIQETLNKILAAGGGTIGKVVTTQ
ncbi:VOC family protein [Shewanella sp. JL219SE-S6]